MTHFALDEESFIILHEVGSTNNYAMGRLNQEKVKAGTAYFALRQTAGKGQRGKHWESAANENITMSLVLTPVHLPIERQFMLSAGIALAGYDFVKKYTGRAAAIKWSNDLYWNDKKTGGLLIENIIRGKEWSYSVAGMGININQKEFSPELPNPVSFHQITGEHYDTISLGKELRECVRLRYEKLIPQNFDLILEEYNSVLYRKEEERLYRRGNDTFYATIRRVEHNGTLVLEKGNRELKVDFGEITFL